MKGKRWNNLTAAYKDFLNTLSTMPDNIVSIFSFDDMPHLLCKYETIKGCIDKATKLTFGGKGTNYARALAQIIYLVTKITPKYSDYLTCILFFSDGAGDPPTTELTQLVGIKNSGKKILLYTIACETDEDDDLKNMAIAMNGDHYKTSSSGALKQIFKKVLSLT